MRVTNLLQLFRSDGRRLRLLRLRRHVRRGRRRRVHGHGGVAHAGARNHQHRRECCHGCRPHLIHENNNHQSIYNNIGIYNYIKTHPNRVWTKYENVKNICGIFLNNVKCLFILLIFLYRFDILEYIGRWVSITFIFFVIWFAHDFTPLTKKPYRHLS